MPCSEANVGDSSSEASQAAAGVPPSSENRRRHEFAISASSRPDGCTIRTIIAAPSATSATIAEEVVIVEVVAIAQPKLL